MIVLRHGQSEFNVRFSATRRDPGIVDPQLTELGEHQAQVACLALAGAGIRRIVASPYTRALQTAAPLARALGLRVQVNPLVRERYAFACDIGSPCTQLATAWPALDFSGIAETWWPAVEEPEAEVAGRAARFCAEMAALGNWSDTLVVSHWGFLLALTGESLENGAWRHLDPPAGRPPS